MTPITWKGWTADYTDAERALMPRTVREAEFIHELKARFAGALMEGQRKPRTDDPSRGEGGSGGLRAARESAQGCPSMSTATQYALLEGHYGN